MKAESLLPSAWCVTSAPLEVDMSARPRRITKTAAQESPVIGDVLDLIAEAVWRDFQRAERERCGVDPEGNQP